MGNFRLLYIGKNLAADLAPYSYTNKERQVAVDVTEDYRKDYENMQYTEDFRNYCEDGDFSFKHFLDYWDGIPAVTADKAAEYEANKEPYALIDKEGNVTKVVRFVNPEGRFYDYMVAEERDTIDWRKELREIEAERRREYQGAVKLLGRQPKFFSNDEVVKMMKNGQFGNFVDGTQEEKEDAVDAANEFYRNQEDRKILAEALPYVEDNLGNCTEEEYVAKGCLPYFAILTEHGWYAPTRLLSGGKQVGRPLKDEDWRNVQIDAIKAATITPDYRVKIVNCLL